MKSNLSLKEAIGTAAESKPQLRLVKTPAAADTAILTGDALRLDQYRRQNEMLQQALKNAAMQPTAEDLQKQYQAPRFDEAAARTVARQASAQENGGTIFSSAFAHIIR